MITGFTGHIVTELLLDAVLIERHGSELLERYYQALRAIDPHVVEQAVNRMARDATNRLAPLIPLFVDENFLWDYLRPETLWKRLNQVMKRIKLNPLPEDVIDLLRDGRTLVESRTDDLLTEQVSEPPE